MDISNDRKFLACKTLQLARAIRGRGLLQEFVRAVDEGRRMKWKKSKVRREDEGSERFFFIRLSQPQRLMVKRREVIGPKLGWAAVRAGSKQLKGGGELRYQEAGVSLRRDGRYGSPPRADL